MRLGAVGEVEAVERRGREKVQAPELLVVR